MSSNTSDLQYLLSLDSSQWQFMLDSHLTHLVFVAAELPITLTRNAIIQIRDTRNRKYRRKYITEFAKLLAGVDITGRTDDALGDLVTIHRVYYETTYDAQVAHIRSNETHDVASAYQIGDSKHYTSCLRSGIQLSGVALSDLTNEDFTSQEFYESLKFRTHSGCNYDEYIPKEELKAFNSGDIQYACVGKLYTEGGDGFLGRYRIHRGYRFVGEEKKTVYVLSDYYGIDSYRGPILAKILEHYGVGNVFVSSKNDYITDGTDRSIEIHDDDCYQAEISKYPNYVLLAPGRLKPFVQFRKDYTTDRRVMILNLLGDNYRLRKIPHNSPRKPSPPNYSTLTYEQTKSGDYTYMCETCATNANKLLELITVITGVQYYTYIIGSYVTVYYKGIRNGRLLSNSGYEEYCKVHLSYKYGAVCLLPGTGDVYCMVSWRDGLKVYDSTGDKVIILGHKNIRKVIKSGLLTLVNQRWKTKHEAL